MEKRNISDREAEEQVWKYAGRVGEKDVREKASKADRISGFFVHVEVLRKYLDDATTIFALLKDRVAGRYAHTPWRTVSALTAALLYVLTPLDVIADFIPFAGYVDDAAVFAFALHFARFDLDAYRDWKRSRVGGLFQRRRTHGHAAMFARRHHALASGMRPSSENLQKTSSVHAVLNLETNPGST